MVRTLKLIKYVNLKFLNNHEFSLFSQNRAGFVRDAPKTRRKNEISYFQKYLNNIQCHFAVV